MAPQVRSGRTIGVGKEKKGNTTTPTTLRTSTIGGRGKGKRIRQTPEPVPPSPRPRSPSPDFERYNCGDLYKDIESTLPDKETILWSCEEKLPTFRNEAKKKLETLVSFLRRKGIGTGAEKTNQETYEEALKLFIEGNLECKLKKDVARQICQYLGMRVFNASKILIEISHILYPEFDASAVSLIVTTLEDLKDIKLTAPELDALESSARVFLSVPQEAQAQMGRAVKDLVNKWKVKSHNQVAMMRVWAESPTWVIDTGRHNRLVCNPSC